MKKICIALTTLMIVGCAEVSFNKQPYDYQTIKIQPNSTMRPKIVSSGNNPPAISFTSESEYWKGN